jgi:glutathione S-transferase
LLFKEWKSYCNLHRFGMTKAPIVEGLMWAALAACIIKRFMAKATQKGTRICSDPRLVTYRARNYAPAVQMRLAGRSSSHFTRVVRVFARELGIAYQFHPILDLMAQTRADYFGNPALRMPVLETEDGPWFGALNICRELARRAPGQLSIVWPEQLEDRVAANAQELVLQGMATEVGLIMRKLAQSDSSGADADKNRRSLSDSVAWLDTHWPAVLERLPRSRGLSFLEVTAYCFVTHLEFRQT